MLRIFGHLPNAFEPPAGGAWSEPGGELGWRNRPGTYPSSEAGNVPMTFWPNRQRASRPDPAGGTPRVDMLGDSITQGYGVADRETYVWRLGELLPGVAFENLGVGGYGTYQSLLVQQARSADPPRVTVYGFYGDHLFRNVAFLSWVRALRDAEGRNIVPPHVTVEGGRLVRHEGSSVPAWPLERQLSTVTELHRAWLRYAFRGRRDFTQAALELLLAEMAATAGRTGSKFVVLLLADAPDWLLPALDARGIVHADCRKPEFEADPALRIGGAGHPTGARHAAWAACLAPVVERALAQ
ncbi:MAG: SGNH/GDSL hydrolase family protein [Proteobacteria bacterium]|nr:SGNH/GDSL hydrolase family protein [Pseudomonadota bacterium]